MTDADSASQGILFVIPETGPNDGMGWILNETDRRRGIHPSGGLLYGSAGYDSPQPRFTRDDRISRDYM